MKLAKRWKKTKDQDSKIISALVTEVNGLKSLLTNKNKHQANATENNPQPSNKKDKLFVPEWHIENKGKSCTCDGTTWYQCPHHKRPGLYDGMYMPHKPCDHDEWKRKKDKRWEKKRNASSDSTGDGSVKSKLQLTKSMHQALVTGGNMAAKQATSLWSKIAEI